MQRRYLDSLLDRFGRPKLYTYQALTDADAQIRIFELLPGERRSPINIRLKTVPLHSAPAFEALSYTWGSTARLRYVYTCENGDTNGAIRVTENCVEALQYLRLRDQSRTLWVDAISINQADLIERGRQVAQMHIIYTKAVQLNIWIGPSSSDSALAMEWIRLAGSRYTTTARSTIVAPLTTDARWNGRVAAMNANETMAVANLINRSWFHRLWVWQEVHAGAHNAYLICGQEVLPWSHFRTAAFYLSGRLFIPCNGYALLDSRLPALFPLFDAYGPLYLVATLHALRSCECTDERDRVYVAQNMARLSGMMPSVLIRPDYTASVEDVYCEAVIKSLEQYQNLLFLRYIGSSKSIPHLPSWVPDWSTVGPNRLFDYTRASSASKAQWCLSDSMELCAAGLAVANITCAMPFGLDDSKPVHKRL